VDDFAASRRADDLTSPERNRSTATAALDVVIVAYRCRDLLRGCLDSLQEYAPRRTLNVFVIDNDSNDGTTELVRREFPEVEIEAANTNLGFAVANNRLIQRGEGEYVLALNPDTVVTEGALDAMLDLIDRRPDVGICGCCLVQENGEFDHASRRSFPTLAGAFGHFTGIGRRTMRGGLAQYRAPHVQAGPVDAVNGAFMLMRRRALDEVGLFDEGFWMYGEDLDLCYRFSEAGWVTWYEPSVVISHVKAGTSGKLRSPRLNYAFHYGMYRFYRKHYASQNRGIWNLAVYVGIGVKLVLSVLRTETLRLVRAASAPTRPT
jgi:GT2 family glycosyltransferase